MKSFEPVQLLDVNRLSPLIHDMEPLHALNTAKTLDTVVVCRVCRGQRVVYVRNKHVGKMYKSNCPHCKGSGEMKN